MIVWLRHGEKAYDNRKGPPGSLAYDPGLADGADVKIRSQAQRLLKLSTPTYIITSPYLRARQTAEILAKEAKLDRSKILCDARLSEYLGNQRLPLQGRITKETAMCSVYPPGESFIAMKKRAVDSLQVLEQIDKDETVWFVTHGIVMEQIHDELARRLQVKSSLKRPEPATGFIIQDTTLALFK